MSLRPFGANLLVTLHPHQKRSSVIELPTNESVVRTGTVFRVGPGKANKNGTIEPMGLEVGEKVAFFRWNQEHKTGKSVQAILEDHLPGVALINQRDVLFVYDGDIQVDQ